MSNMSSVLESVVINPKNKHTATVIWLHGLGADGYDFVDVIPQLRVGEAIGIQYVFPHAPYRAVTINNGLSMRAWYDITSFNAHGLQDDINSMQVSVAQVEGLIAQQVEQGIPREKILLIGFSQGGAIALLAGLQNPCAGVIALSTYLPDTDLPLLDKPCMPVLMIHGTHDTILPVALAKASFQKIQSRGYPARFIKYPMAHTICLEELQVIASFIEEHLR